MDEIILLVTKIFKSVCLKYTFSTTYQDDNKADTLGLQLIDVLRQSLEVDLIICKVQLFPEMINICILNIERYLGIKSTRDSCSKLF